MTVLRRDDRVLWRRSGHRIVLLGPMDEGVSVLEDSAALVWDLLAEPLDRQELCELLGDHFGRSPVDIEGDLAPFLGDLTVRGVLTVDASS